MAKVTDTQRAALEAMAKAPLFYTVAGFGNDHTGVTCFPSATIQALAMRGLCSSRALSGRRRRAAITEAGRRTLAEQRNG